MAVQIRVALQLWLKGKFQPEPVPRVPQFMLWIEENKPTPVWVQIRTVLIHTGKKFSIWRVDTQKMHWRSGEGEHTLRTLHRADAETT